LSSGEAGGPRVVWHTAILTRWRIVYDYTNISKAT
jgi:hypothetical protein